MAVPDRPIKAIIGTVFRRQARLPSVGQGRQLAGWVQVGGVFLGLIGRILFTFWLVRKQRK